MSKSIINRIVWLSVCVAVIIVAVLIGIDYNAVSAGRGSGTNARVSSVKAVSEMLGSFSDQLSDFGYGGSERDGANALASDKAKGNVYSSATMRERSSVRVSVDVSGASEKDSRFSKSTVQREMTVYIAPGVTYYHSIATLASDSMYYSVVRDDDGNIVYESKDNPKYEQKKAYRDIDMDMELYISETKFLLRFNKLKVAIDGKNWTGVERILGKWGDFSDDSAAGRAFISAIGSVNSNNFRLLGLIGRGLMEYEGDGFTKRGDSYSMKSDTFREFAEGLLSVSGGGSLDESFKGDFEVDLGDPESPVIELLLKNELDNSSNGIHSTAEMAESDEFQFSDINNTVVSLPRNISTVSAEEFNSIMEEITEED